MKIDNMYGIDKKKEEEGVWIKADDGAEVLIARAGNPRYQKEMSALIRAVQNLSKRRKLSPEEMNTIAIKVLARTILLGWKKIEEKDKLVPYNEENAIRLLTTYSVFREDVEAQSEDLNNFYAEIKEEQEKNLPAT